MCNNDYIPELNFSFEFDLSRNGMIKEIEKEFNTIRIALVIMKDYENEYSDEIDRIVVIPLRKLLCEKNSVLLKVCPDFKMMPIKGSVLTLDDRLVLNAAPYEFSHKSEWITLNDWLKSDVAYYTKDADDVPISFKENDYITICNKLKGNDKHNFMALFKKSQLTYYGEKLDGYIMNRVDRTTKETVYKYLKEIGYYNLSVYNYIKHLADKRGAHLDTSFSALIESLLISATF